MANIQIPVVNKSCCGCSLRLGCLIIAYYGLFSGIIMPLFIANWTHYQESVREEIEVFQSLYISKDAIILNTVVSILVALVGLYGIYQENVPATFIYFGIHFIGFIFGFIEIYHSMAYHEPATVILSAWTMLIVKSYIILILYSFCRQMWDKKVSELRSQNDAVV